MSNQGDSEQKLSVEEEQLRVAIQQYEQDNMGIAISQFLALAERDCEEAYLYLSLIYREGDGTPKDELKAARYKKQYVRRIEKLASAGHPGFRLKLAYILQFGDGVAIDNNRAFMLFLELAQDGCGEAQFHLSRIYARGECGQAMNTELELQWLDEATKSEWPKALYYSALFLESSACTEESFSQVKNLMLRSSELGCWQAKEYLLAQR